MNLSDFRQIIKPWMLPIAMVIGMIFHSAIESVQFLAPYLIFIMLLITFCKVDPSHMRFDKLTWLLLTVQMLGSVLVYFAMLPFSHELAEATFICVFCPTATAAPVITGMLGGSVTRVAMYSIISNVAVALSAPALFEYMGGESLAGSVSFVQGFATICAKVGPLIILPLLTAFLLKAIAPGIHKTIATHQSLSFYIWAVSLIIVVGKSVSFVMNEPKGTVPLMIAIAVGAMIVCVIQFIIGRRIGRRFGDPVAGAQGLAQKNTVLAIWMALNFLSPVSSVGPASYILWQNTINSAQIFFKNRRSPSS